MPRGLNFALAAALLCWGAVAGAHNYHMGMADISYNGASGNTEIVHTYTAHDVEALLADLYQRRLDLGRDEDEQLLRDYVERRFFIETPQRARLAPRWVGLKLDADNVVVFQEIEGRQLAPGSVIHNRVLIDFLPAQRNTLNLRGAASAPVQTFLFDRASGAQTVR